MKPHEPCASRGDCYHARNGRNQGRRNVESGHWARIQSLGASLGVRILNANPEAQEWRSRGGRIGGPIGARKTNATWGKTPEAREARARNMRKLNATWGKTSEAHKVWARNGRSRGLIQGRKNVENGVDFAAMGRIGGRIGGRINGRKNIESGQLARIAKGVPSTADGILFRSQTEATFYCVTKELGGEPRYEPYTVELPDGRSYTPDFVLDRPVFGLPANVPIELKPSKANTYYNGNVEKAIEAGAVIVYWDELVDRGSNPR